MVKAKKYAFVQHMVSSHKSMLFGFSPNLTPVRQQWYQTGFTTHTTPLTLKSPLLISPHYQQLTYDLFQKRLGIVRNELLQINIFPKASFYKSFILPLPIPPPIFKVKQIRISHLIEVFVWSVILLKYLYYLVEHSLKFDLHFK